MKEYKLTKEEFKEEMKKRRLELFKKSNHQLDKIINSENDFLQYLKLQATLGYTISNTLMIMHDNPSVTLLKDYPRWKELGAFPNKNEKGIPILEPSGTEYTRKDGTRGVNYNIKYLFDVSQTNYTGELLNPKYPSAQDIIDGLSYKTEINPIIIKDTSHLPRRICYHEKDNCIYVQLSLEMNHMILGLMREYAYIETIKPESYIKGKAFSIYCITYMLAMKYNIPFADVSFMKDFSSFFANKSNKVIKKNLDDMRKLFYEISKRIDYGIYAKYYNQGSD